jgi:hypothetical protein
MGTVLVIIGIAVCLTGSIWLLVEAFKESLLWGLGSLFVPLVSLIFVIMFWNRAGKPFLLYLAGMVPLAIGLAMIWGSA